MKIKNTSLVMIEKIVHVKDNIIEKFKNAFKNFKIYS